MTNTEIIMGAMKLAGLNPMTDVVDTFAGWKRRGYSVNRGEKAKFATKIWKPTKFKTKDEHKKDEDTEDTTKRLILVTASFFTSEQVHKTEEEENEV